MNKLLPAFTSSAVTLATAVRPVPLSSRPSRAATFAWFCPSSRAPTGQRALEDLLATFKTRYREVTVEVDYTSYSKLSENLTTSVLGAAILVPVIALPLAVGPLLFGPTLPLLVA